MKVEVDDRPTSRKCRYCKERARWDVMKFRNSSWADHNPVCDKHLGTAMRNIGLVRLSIEQTATCTARIEP